MDNINPFAEEDRERKLMQREVMRWVTEKEKEEAAVRLYTQDAATLLKNAPLETPFVIDQVIPEQGICFLAGRPGSAKSWLAYGAALAVTRGEPWMGYGVPNRGDVLVLNYDNPNHELGRRFRKLGLRPDDRIRFHSPADRLLPGGLPSMLQLPEAITPLYWIINYCRPKLVIIDSYRQSNTCDEKNSADMGRIMSIFRTFTSFGCSVLVLHHLRKSQPGKKDEQDEEPLRGSTEIEASADCILIIKDDKISYLKTRGFDPSEESWTFKVVDNEEKTTTTIESFARFAKLASALKEAGGSLRRRALYSKLGLSVKEGNDLVEQAERAGVVMESREEGTRVVSINPNYVGGEG